MINRMKIDWQILFMQAVPEIYRQDMQAVWRNFIDKLEHVVLKTNDIDYLAKNLEHLNFAWNHFHTKMSKHHSTRPSKKILTSLTTIHRRWNSILKVILN